MMIHWSRVKALRDEVGTDEFAEVVELFLDEADATIARLGPGMDPSRLEQDLHFLRGSAVSFGFAEFSDLCAEGERRSAAGDDEIDLARLRQVFAQSRAALVAGLVDLS